MKVVHLYQNIKTSLVNTTLKKIQYLPNEYKKYILKVPI